MSNDKPKLMSQGDFGKGWKLLIIQPWGWRYNQTDRLGKPTTEAQAQLEFYYDKLKWADPRAWWKTAETYAQGKEWPSVNELRTTLLSINAQFVKVLQDTRPSEPMPEGVRNILDRLLRT